MKNIRISTSPEIMEYQENKFIEKLKLINFFYEIKYKSYLIFLVIIYIIISNNIEKKKNSYFYRKRLHFLKKNNKIYNESNIITIEDKLNWLAINDVNELKGNCSDKILLHEYSKKKLGKDICNKILKIYDNEEQINFDELPKQFVIKTNHGSGFNIIVDNKTNLNINNTKKSLSEWMKKDYGKIGAEFHYSFIKKKIFVEEYIGSNLKNYKFLCYNGNPKYVYVSIKEKDIKFRNFYDMNWNYLNFSCLSKPHPTYNYSKPKLFELMKKYAQKLSSDFKFVRVDLYELKNEVRLGELTFIPMNSFFYCKNKEHEIEIGKDIIIN